MKIIYKKDMSGFMDGIFTWKIKVGNSPLLIKKCSRCDSERFYCSGKFRMNAQKKNIDVWLIYKCAKCDQTCNLTIVSRSKPDLIDRALFHSFSVNDAATAWKYAFSAELERMNHLKLDQDSVAYEIVDDITMEDLNCMDGETVGIRIECAYQFHLKLSSLIRKRFSLSSGRVRKMFEQGMVFVSSDKPLSMKQKVKPGDTFFVHKLKFIELLKEMR